MKNKKAILVILLFFGFLTYAYSAEFFTTSVQGVVNKERTDREGRVLAYEMNTCVDKQLFDHGDMEYMVLTNTRGGLIVINLTKDKAELEYYRKMMAKK